MSSWVVFSAQNLQDLRSQRESPPGAPGAASSQSSVRSRAAVLHSVSIRPVSPTGTRSITYLAAAFASAQFGDDEGDLFPSRRK